MEEKKAELSDEQLDGVVGGLFVVGISLTCSRCGRKFSSNGERENDERTCRG